MRQWLVGGGLILGEGGLLLVRNRRRNGDEDWSPPGGVIDEGETLLAGLTREVEEETGVVVARWAGPAYEVEVEAPGLGWHLRVEAHVAVDFAGEVRIDDPDGIVIDAAYVAPTACDAHLAGCRPWVSEPLTAWLAEPWSGDRAPCYRYVIDGDDPLRAVVSRR
ncbi:MAG TPA: NUDIX domain-containing protein [Acidimicrobiales bacterium]|nr:NUDIX domain-containing protein [Acidimicrobiales bacterium]